MTTFNNLNATFFAYFYFSDFAPDRPNITLTRYSKLSLDDSDSSDSGKLIEPSHVILAQPVDQELWSELCRPNNLVVTQTTTQKPSNLTNSKIFENFANFDENVNCNKSASFQDMSWSCTLTPSSPESKGAISPGTPQSSWGVSFPSTTKSKPPRGTRSNSISPSETFSSSLVILSAEPLPTSLSNSRRGPITPSSIHSKFNKLPDEKLSHKPTDINLNVLADNNIPSLEENGLNKCSLGTMTEECLENNSFNSRKYSESDNGKNEIE